LSLQTITRHQPILVEGLIIIIIGLGFTANTTLMDISFHQNYVGLIVEWCHPEQQDGFCTWAREELNQPIDSQIGLGEKYWSEFNRQAAFIILFAFSIRLFAVGGLLQATGIQRIRITTVLMASFWGVVAGGLFIFGFVDTFYYWFQLEVIPEDLPWLSNAGIFIQTRAWTGDPTVVEIEDLYLTNILGIATLGFVWWLTWYFFKESGMKRAIA